MGHCLICGISRSVVDAVRNREGYTLGCSIESNTEAGFYYRSAQALISQIDTLNKDNNPSFALGVTVSAQVLIDAARSI